MTETDADVPCGEDFHDPLTATRWAEAASKKRPWRTDFFRAFADAISLSPLHAPRILELGSGPGFLAEFVLDHCPKVTDYTLLDFARPMLQLSQKRLHPKHPRSRYVCVNFKLSSWTSAVSEPFDFVLSLQAVHELRHKRHAPTLYTHVRSLLSPTGKFLVCDHLPGEQPSTTRQALYMTIDENLASLAAAGFPAPLCIKAGHDMALFSAAR